MKKLFLIALLTVTTTSAYANNTACTATTQALNSDTVRTNLEEINQPLRGSLPLGEDAATAHKNLATLDSATFALDQVKKNGLDLALASEIRDSFSELGTELSKLGSKLTELELRLALNLFVISADLNRRIVDVEQSCSY